MSRAVQEDLSGLSFGERTAKRWDNFKVWVYDPKDKTYLGSRPAKDWGKLLLYYLVFYSVLAAFTAIFFALLGFMLPPRPNEVVRGICSNQANAINFCGKGPFFQALDLGEVDGDLQEDSVKTDTIFKFGICEPAFAAIPRALALGGTAKPTDEYNFDENRKGYKQFTDEVDRVYCQNVFSSQKEFNPDCGSGISVNKRILPLVPLSPDDVVINNGTQFRSPDNDQFANIATELSDDPYERPKPIYKFGANNAYETYMVFFRFNKVWNYQPYAVLETSPGVEPEIQNDIGITCVIPNACAAGSGSGKNYENKDAPCDGSTVSSDKRVVINMLSNVMTNYDKFPWRGGALNMNFGSMAVTYFNNGQPLPDDLKIECTMGVAIPNGYSSVGGDGTPVSASANSIANLDKQGPARAYTKSDGRSFTIDINNN